MNAFERLFEELMLRVCAENPDPSRDILHVKRVVSLAKALAEAEGAIGLFFCKASQITIPIEHTLA